MPSIIVEKLGGVSASIDLLRSKGLVDQDARCIDDALFARRHSVVVSEASTSMYLCRNAFVGCILEVGAANVEFDEPGSGSLVYRGSMPEVISLAAVGRLLEDLFDHAWLQNTGLEIEHIFRFEGRMKVEFAAPYTTLAP